MASPVKATKDAQKLLQQYSAEKTRLSQAAKKSNGVNVEDDMDTAVAEGSILGQAYSEKKRRLREFSSPQPHDADRLAPGSGHSEEAVDAIRQALYELDAMENADDVADDIKDRIPAITKLLQGVEGHLESEVEALISRQYPKKILFSPGSGNASAQNEDHIDITGSPSDTPRAKDVLKVYMKNQLDLQESEWESYEDTFNAVAEKLDAVEEQLAAMTEERDALLSEKQTWEEHKVDYDALSLNLASWEQKYTEEAARAKRLQHSLDEAMGLFQTTTPTTTPTATPVGQNGDEDKVRELEEKIAGFKSQIRDSEHECDLLSELLEEKNAVISTLEASLTEAAVHGHDKSRDDSQILHTSVSEAVAPDKDVLKVYMRNQLELQENEWEQYEETINTLTEQLESTEGQLSAVQMDKVTLDEELARVKVMLTTRDFEMEAMASDISKLQDQLAEANYDISELKTALTEKDSVATSEAGLLISLQEKLRLEMQSREDLEGSHFVERRDMQHKIGELRAQIDEMTRDMDMLQMSTQSYTDIIAERDAHIDGLESELRRLETVDKELSDIQEKCQCMEKLNDSLQEEMVKKVSVIEELQTMQQCGGMQASEEFVNDVEKSPSRAQEQADLQRMLTNAKHEIINLLAEKKQLQEELASQADMYADELQDVRNSLLVAQTQVSAHAVDIRRLQDVKQEEKIEDVVAASSELKHISEKISKLEAENAELRGQLHQIAHSPPRAGSAPTSPSNGERALTGQSAIEQQHQELLDKIISLETQNYHLQECSGLKDSTIRRMRQIFADQMAVGGMSPPDSPTHGPSGESPDDLERALEVMEKKMQVQIRNLQYLQDSVSDEKQRVKALLSNKSALQDKIASLETTIRNQDSVIQQAKIAAIESSGRETNLMNDIEGLNGKIAELNYQVDDVRVQLETSQSLIESLQTQNAEGRKLLEEKSITLDTMTTSIAATVSSPGIVHRAECRADKASTRLKALEQEMLELRSLNSALEANLSHKTARAEELSKEVGRLRGMITAKVDEISELRARDLRVEAELSAQLMEKERTTDGLRDLIQRMEDNKKEAEDLLEERLRKLLDEQETNKQLRQLLMMVNEKDSTTEELIYQLQMQEGSITMRLEETVTNLHKETKRCEDLEEQLGTARKQLASLQSDLLNVQSSDSASFAVADDNIKMLRAQLSEADNMLAEKIDEAEELQGFVREMEDEIYLLKGKISSDAKAHRLIEEDKSSMYRSLSHISDETKYVSDRQLEHMRALEASVDRISHKYNDRLLSCVLKLDVLSKLYSRREAEIRDAKRDVDDVMAEKQKWEQKVTNMEDMLEKSREAVRIAEMALDRKEFEKNELTHRLQSASRNMSFGGEPSERGAVVAVEDKALSLDDEASRSAITMIEEFSKLAERFEIAEKRTMEMSAQGARNFAKTAKGMALLEGENARLKSLVDHLRLVNAKLMGDIKVASTVGLQSNALTSRFRILEQELQSYMQRCAALETEIEEKENALIESVEESQLLEEQRVRSFEEEMKAERERIINLMDESAAKDRTIRRIQDLNDSLQRQIEKEMESAHVESESSRADIQAALVRAENAESFSSTLRLRVAALESEKINLENSLEEMTRSRDEKIAGWAQKKEHFDGVVESLKATISDLERAVESGNASIRSLEEEVAVNESSLQELTAKLQDAEGDYNDSVSRLRELEQSLENVSIERGRLELKCADLSEYLDEARKQLEAQDNELRAGNAKSGKAEGKIRKIASEKHALEVIIEEMRLQNEGMLDTTSIAESKVDELQFDLTQAKNEIELLESEVLDKKGELIHVKSQLESTSREKSNLEKEVALHQQKLATLKVTMDRLTEVENTLHVRDVDLRQVNGAEHMLIMDMKAVMTRLETVMSICRKTKSTSVEYDVGGVSAPATQQGGPRNEMLDLLATPLKNLLTPSKELSAAINRERVSGVRDQSGADSLTIDTQLTELRHNFEKLVVMTDEHLLRSAQLEESHRSLHLKIAESKRSYESSDHKYRALLAEKEAISSRLEESQNEVRALNDEIDGLIEERDDALHAGEEHAQWIRLIRRDLEEVIESDEVIRVLSLTAVEMERDGDHSADVAFSGALVESVSISSHPLRDAIAQSRATVSKMCKHLRSVQSTLQTKEHTLKKLEVQVVSLQQNWDADVDKLQAKNNDLTTALDRERALLIQTKADLHAHENENSELKTLVSEYSQQNLDLEDDVRASNEAVGELRAALKEAEALCVELRGRIRLLSSEKGDMQQDLSTASNELAAARTKIANLVMQVEQWSSDCKRVKVERDNLLELRNTLQSEAEMARAEAAIAMEKVRTRKSDDDIRASFELERLLAALGATLDNVIGVSTSGNTVPRITDGTAGVLDTSIQSLARDRSGRHSLNSSFSSEKSMVDSNAGYSTIATRVESSVKRLTELRGLSRDERRGKRQLEEKILALQHEMESFRLSAEQEKEDMRVMLTEHNQKEKEVTHQLQYMESLSSQNVRLQDDINRLKQERDMFISGVDTEKKSLAGALASIRLRDGEIDNLKESLNEKTNECQAKADSFRDMENEVNDLRSRVTEKDDALRSAKATGARLQGTVERLEGSLERTKKEKAELERKLKSAYDHGGGGGSHVVQTGSRIRELERELSEAHRLHRDRELEMEERILSLTTDNVDLTGRIESLEERLRQVSADGSSQRKENTMTSQELYRLQSRLDKEIADHKKTQSALQNMRNLEEDWRLQAEGTTALMDEEEQRSMKAEAKTKELEEQVAELKVSLTEKDAATQMEREKRLRAEQDVQRQNILLERTQRELTLTSTKASALRAEGRKARQEILEAAECLRDVAGILQATDSIANGGDSTLQLEYDIDIDTDISRSISMIMPEHRGKDAETDHGGDSLGVQEVVAIVNTIRSFSTIIRRLPQNQAAFESTLRRLETENTRLQRELDGIEIVNGDRVQRLHSEIAHLEEQLRSYRRNIDTGKDTARTITHLEHEITLLRERSNKCDRKEKEMLLEIANLTTALESQNERVASAAETGRYTVAAADTDRPALTSTEEQLLHKVQTLQQELDAVRHHRTVLQNSVSEMESMVFKDEKDFSDRTSWIAPPTASHRDTSTDQDFEQLNRRLQRYQRRMQSVEQLNGIYRKGLLALYTDGSFYGALQFEAKKHYQDQNSDHGWIEREIALITKGYVDEIELLEKECDDLVAQVKEGDSYRAELRVRLEDTLRALYRGGKGQFAEALSHQLEHMSVDLKKSQHQAAALSQQLADTQRSHRLRHDKLVAEFTRSIQTREDISSRAKKSESELKKLSDANVKTIQSLNRDLSECKSLVSRLHGERDEKDRLIKEKDRAIVQLRRELIDVDSQLDSERRRHASALRAAEKIRKEEDDEAAAATARTDTSWRRQVVIPAVDAEKVLPPPPTVPAEDKGREKKEYDREKASLSETFTNRSPPPRPRPTSAQQESPSFHRGASIHRTYPALSGASVAGGAPSARPSRYHSPSRTSASYAATTASFRSGRQVADTSSTTAAEANPAPRMRTVRASSTLSATSSLHRSSRHEQSTTELFERPVTGSSVASGGGSGPGSGRVPEWHNIEAQGESSKTRDISPVVSRKSHSQSRR